MPLEILKKTLDFSGWMAQQCQPRMSGKERFIEMSLETKFGSFTVYPSSRLLGQAASMYIIGARVLGSLAVDPELQ